MKIKVKKSSAPILQTNVRFENIEEFKFVRLVINSRDLNFPLAFTMYNVVREGRKAAKDILERGQEVIIICAGENENFLKRFTISKPEDFLTWENLINEILIDPPWY